MKRSAVLGLALVCVAALVLISGQIKGQGAGSTRALAHGFAAPKGWVIHHRTTFNGARVSPAEIDMIDWIGDMAMAGGGITAGRIPVHSGGSEMVEVSADWIEWKSGKAFRADLKVAIPQGGGVATIRFERDGALSVYLPSDDLAAGKLGRPASFWDHDEVARICGTALTEAEATKIGLTQARRNDFGIDFATADPRKLPDAPLSQCSEG